MCFSCLYDPICSAEAISFPNCYYDFDSFCLISPTFGRSKAHGKKGSLLFVLSCKMLSLMLVQSSVLIPVGCDYFWFCFGRERVDQGERK